MRNKAAAYRDQLRRHRDFSFPRLTPRKEKETKPSAPSAATVVVSFRGLRREKRKPKLRGLTPPLRLFLGGCAAGPKQKLAFAAEAAPSISTAGRSSAVNAEFGAQSARHQFQSHAAKAAANIFVPRDLSRDRHSARRKLALLHPKRRGASQRCSESETGAAAPFRQSRGEAAQ